MLYLRIIAALALVVAVVGCASSSSSPKNERLSADGFESGSADQWDATEQSGGGDSVAPTPTPVSALVAGDGFESGAAAGSATTSTVGPEKLSEGDFESGTTGTLEATGQPAAAAEEPPPPTPGQ